MTIQSRFRRLVFGMRMGKLPCACFMLNSISCPNSDASQTLITAQGEVVKVPFLRLCAFCCHSHIFGLLSFPI